MDSNKFPHQRKRKGLITETQTHWYNSPLTSSYLVKNTLNGSERTQYGHPVILLPGGFDPHQGTYSENVIRQLLTKPNINAVYDVHFYSEKRAGYLDPESFIQDITKIYTTEGKKPILVGMSGSTLLLLFSLYRLKQKNHFPNAQSTLLIGPYVPSHHSLLGKNISLYYNRKKLREKVANHCGHQYLFGNSDRIQDYWDSNPVFSQAIRKKEFHNLAGSLKTSLDVLFFKLDTLSASGKRMLQDLFGANILKSQISKHHRSLLHIPEFDEMLADYCNEAGAPVDLSVQDRTPAQHTSSV